MAGAPHDPLLIKLEGPFDKLEDGVSHIDWTPTEGGNLTYEFALFSRSGFKRSVEEVADERDDLHLFDLSDIVAVLEERSEYGTYTFDREAAMESLPDPSD